MATLVRTLKRAISSSTEPDSAQASPSAPLARSSTIAASPSFSDFSLNTHSDGATPLALSFSR